MGNSTLPTVLDKLFMVVNINARKLIGVKNEEIKMNEAKIQALQEMTDSLEERLNGHAMRQDAVSSKITNTTESGDRVFDYSDYDYYY